MRRVGAWGIGDQAPSRGIAHEFALGIRADYAGPLPQRSVAFRTTSRGGVHMCACRSRTIAPAAPQTCSSASSSKSADVNDDSQRGFAEKPVMKLSVRRPDPRPLDAGATCANRLVPMRISPFSYFCAPCQVTPSLRLSSPLAHLDHEATHANAIPDVFIGWLRLFSWTHIMLLSANFCLRSSGEQAFGERARDRRRHLDTNDLIRRAVPIVEEVEHHFYVPLDAFGCRQLREPKIMGRYPSELDDHNGAPWSAG